MGAVHGGVILALADISLFAVARLMLKADAAHPVGDRMQKIIMVVMLRAEERQPLSNVHRVSIGDRREHLSTRERGPDPTAAQSGIV